VDLVNVATAAIAVLEPGPQTTVQDLGRPGHLRSGIPPSGPVDRPSFVIANRLVGNADGAAGLECTVMGPRFEATAAGAIAVTGAEMPVTLNGTEVPSWSTLVVRPGDVVRVGPARAGARGYIAFAGGIDVPVVLGSRSTYLRGRLGGIEGRALRKGDSLCLFPAPLPLIRSMTPRPVAFGDEPVLRVVLGPQAHRFTDEGIATLLGHAYEMLPQSDRMGARLAGPRIAHRGGHDILSDGIAFGSIQVPGDGQPIALLVDRQTTGGYTKIATICSFDIGRLGQVKPGQRMRFAAVSVADAHAILREAEAALAQVLV
jgi:antagonist of KipI